MWLTPTNKKYNTKSQAVVNTCYEVLKAALNGVKSYSNFIEQKEEMSPVK